MIFVYKNWERFCKSLKEKGIISISAQQVESGKPFLVLKHDIECNVSKAYKLAEIEHRYGHCGSYYAHAYLLDDPKNVAILQKMRDMGHEISYHYDVMDSNKGNIDQAVLEFDRNLQKFESLGFHLETVCQHGNPVVERVGYTSNRDFFRNESVRERYSGIADIMVNYKERYNTDYRYYSDAGRKFKLIFDPINNDIVNSDDKNISYPDLKALLNEIDVVSCAIVSTHPHRWTKSAVMYKTKEICFKCIRTIAKIMMRIPFLKKIMGKYYYLAKKI